MKPLKTREELILNATKKLQMLTNYGLCLHSDTGKPIDNIHQVATRLTDDTTYMIKCTLPDDHASLCISLSNNALAQLKTYLTDVFLIEQSSSGKHYILCSNTKEEFTLLTQSDDIQIVDTFEFVCSYKTLPTYTNRGNLYTVYTPPILTGKTIQKICNASDKIEQCKNTHYLLSDNVRTAYNMPLTVAKKLGENVISLPSLNLLEIIMCHSTNSSSVFAKKSDPIKPFHIPYNFFANEDFGLNQTIDEISSNLQELRSIGLINSFTFNPDTISFDIVSNIIQKSIKQHVLVQNIGYYKSFNLHQATYCLSFVNYLLYCAESIKARLPKSSSDDTSSSDETQATKPAPTPKLKVCLGKILYFLDQEEHMHDHTRIAQILNNCHSAGMKANLLEPLIQPISPNDVKRMLSYPESFSDYFVIHIASEEEKLLAQQYKQVIPLLDLDISPSQGRTYFKNR